MKTRVGGISRTILVILIGVFAASWQLNAAAIGKAIGKGIGKGKGVAVAGTSYYCLGVEQANNQVGSPYSLYADSIVIDGEQSNATLEGAATGELVIGYDATVPTHMAGASVKTMILQPFNVCAASAGSILNAVVVGADNANPEVAGTAPVQFVFDVDIKLEFQKSDDSEGIFSSLAETTLQVLGLDKESFKVSAQGDQLEVEAPQDLTVTDLSDGEQYLFEIKGKHAIDGFLNYGMVNGEPVENIVQTTFVVSGEVTGLDIEGSQIVAGFANAEAMNTLTYKINSLDPNVTFSILAPETTEDESVADTEL